MNSDLTHTFEALQKFEQGEFQELGDELLPWAFPELQHLKPYGLTRAGKTRVGVPDSYVGPTPREATIAVEYTTQESDTARKLAGDYASVRERCPRATVVYLCTNRVVPEHAAIALRAKAAEDQVRLDLVDGSRLAAILAGERQDVRQRHLKIPIGVHTTASLLAALSRNVATASRGRSASVDSGRFLPRFRLDVLCFERIRREPCGTTLLLGEAGQGKSSWSIDYARRFAVVHPTVWLHALDLHDGAADPLGEAVALAAYGSADAARLLELSLLLKREQQTLVLFIDGADESRDYTRLERTLRAFRKSATGALTHIVLCCRAEAEQALKDVLVALIPDITSEGSTLYLGPLRDDERGKLFTMLGASHVARRSIENHLTRTQIGNPLFIEIALALEGACVLDRSGPDLMAAASDHFVNDICKRLRDNGRAPSNADIERFFVTLAETLSESVAGAVSEERARGLSGDTASGENTLVSRALQTPLLVRTLGGVTFGHALFLEHFVERGLLTRPDRILAAAADPERAARVARRAPIAPETAPALLALAQAHPLTACVLLARGDTDPRIGELAFTTIEALLMSRYPSEVRRGLRFLESVRSDKARSVAVAWFKGLSQDQRRSWIYDAAELFFVLQVPEAAEIASLSFPFRHSWFEPTTVRAVDQFSPLFREAIRAHARQRLGDADDATRERCVNILALLRDESLIDHLSSMLERALLDEGAHHALVFLNTHRAIALYSTSIDKTLAAYESARSAGSQERALDRIWSRIVPHTTDLIMLPHGALVGLVKELLASQDFAHVAVGAEWARLLHEPELFVLCAAASRRFPDSTLSMTSDLGRLLSSVPVTDIRAMFEASDAALRQTVVHNVGEIPRPGLESFLVERLAEGEHRLSAIQSLRRIGAVSAAPHVARFLDDPAPQVRMMAVRTVGYLRYLPSAAKLSEMIASAPVGGDYEYVLINALGSLGAPRAVDALERHYSRTRYPVDVLASVLRLGLEHGVTAAERLSEDPASWPLLTLAISKVGSRRSHFGDALDGSGVPRQAHEPPFLIRSGLLLERVIRVARERLEKPLHFMDQTLHAVATFDLEEAIAFLQEIAARSLLPQTMLRPDEKTVLKDPAFEARELLVNRGDEKYALDLLVLDLESAQKSPFLHGHELQQLSRYPRRLVRKVVLEAIEQGRNVAPTLGILAHFLESEDLPLLSRLEQSADIAVADEAHRALRAHSAGGTR